MATWQSRDCMPKYKALGNTCYCMYVALGAVHLVHTKLCNFCLLINPELRTAMQCGRCGNSMHGQYFLYMHVLRKIYSANRTYHRNSCTGISDIDKYRENCHDIDIQRF